MKKNSNMRGRAGVRATPTLLLTGLLATPVFASMALQYPLTDCEASRQAAADEGEANGATIPEHCRKTSLHNDMPMVSSIVTESVGLLATLDDKFFKVRTGSYASDVAATAAESGIAIGGNAKSTGLAGVAIGGNTKAGVGSVALGTSSEALGTHSSALGDTAKAMATDSIAVGYWAVTDDVESIAIGVNSNAKGRASIAIGRLAKAEGATSVAIGNNANASGTNGVSIGVNSQAIASSLATGNGAAATGKTSMAIGTQSSALSESDIALGYMAKADGYGAIALGVASLAEGQGSLAIGWNASSPAFHSMTIGVGSKTEASESIAYGYHASTKSSATNSVALGNYSVASEADTVSIGSETTLRRLVKVKDGRITSGSSDAVTGGQLYTTNNTVSALAGRVSKTETDITNISKSAGGLVTLDSMTGDVKVASDKAGFKVHMAGTLGDRVLDGVSAGRLSGTSNEAVNGSQLYTTNTTVSGLAGRVSTNETGIGGIKTDISGIRKDITDMQSGGGGGGLVTLDEVGDVMVASNEAGMKVHMAGKFGARVLDGVAAGNLSASSTEAVNGSQLFATNTAVGELTGRVSTTETGIGGLNTSITNIQTDINDIRRGGVGVVTLDETTGNVKVASDAAGSRVHMAGTAGARVLDGVAAGNLSASSTEAVNGSQLFTTNTAVGELTGRVSTTETGIGGLNTSITNMQTDINEIRSGGVGLVTLDETTGNVKVASNAAGSKVHMAGTAGARVLDGVAAGKLSASSTEAVNGSQLFTTNGAVDVLTGRVSTNEGGIGKIRTDIGAIQESIANMESSGGGGGEGLVKHDASAGLTTIAAAKGGDAVSIEGTDGRRRLTGIANGIEDADAVSIAQLKAASAIDPTTGETLTVLTYDDLSLARATLGGTNGTVLANLADGQLSAGSTEAVNGSQLFATNTAVGELTGRVSTNETGIGKIATDITDIRKDITGMQNGGVGLVTLDETTGNVKVASNAAGSRVHMAGTAGARVLDGVAAGTLSAGSTEAVNGSQLFATNGAVDVLTGRVSTNEGGIGKIRTDIGAIQESIANMESGGGGGGEGLVKHDASAGLTTIAAAKGGDAVSIEGTDGRRRLTGIANGIEDADAVSIAQLKAASGIDPTTGETLTVLTYDDLSLARATLGGTNGTVLANLADGLLSADSTEAVNGSQLFATNTAVGELTGRVSTTETGIGGINTSITNIQKDINEFRSGGQGLVTLDETTGDVKVASNVGGAMVHMAGTAGARVVDGLAAGALSSTSTQAVNGAQLFATNVAVDALTGRVLINEGGLGTIRTDIDAMQESIANMESGGGGGGGGGGGAGDGLVKHDAASGVTTIAAEEGGDVVSVEGEDGKRRLSGLANGTEDSDAVSIAQLRAATEMDPITGGRLPVLTYDDMSLARASLGGTNGTVLGNLANGLVSTGSLEAVNGGQLWNLQQDMQAQLDLMDGRVATIERGVADGSIGGGSPGVGEDGSVSIGDGSAAEGDGAVAIGDGSTAPGDGSTAIGDGSTAPGDGSVAIGEGSTSPGDGSTAIGDGSTAPGDGSVAVGEGSTSPGDGSTAIGDGSAAEGDGSVAIGEGSTSPGDGSTAVGGGSAAEGDGSVAIGEGSTSPGDGSTAVGGGSAAEGDGSVAVGEGSGAKGEGSTAVGGGSAADGNGSVAVGEGSGAKGEGSTAVGGGSAADGNRSVAVGEGSGAKGEGSTAVGGDSAADGKDSVAVGGGSAASGDGSVAIGNGSKAPGKGAVAVGDGAAAEGDHSTAIGNDASATGNNSVAIGAGSVADRDNVVSVGSAGSERQITNVADGTAATDAVNVRQLEDRFQQSKDYTDMRYRMVNERIDRMGAMSAAYAGMALNTAGLPGNNRIGVGIGAQSGREALAVGYQRVMGRRNNISASLGGAFSGSDRSITAGAGVSW